MRCGQPRTHGADVGEDAMRDEVKTFTQSEIIALLKKGADQWVVSEINGCTWFSDGKAIIRCDGEALDNTHVQFSRAWESAIFIVIERIPDGYVEAIEDCLCGSFIYGYSRLFTSPDRETHVYLNEMYVRAVWRSRVQADVWINPEEPRGAAMFVDEGKIVAAIMPLSDIRKDQILLKHLPEIPFLEDAALYFRRNE